MTFDPDTLLAIDVGQPARPIVLIDRDGFDAWIAGAAGHASAAVIAQGFRGKAFTHAIVPGAVADDWSIVAGATSRDDLTPWCLAGLAETLPAGTYRVTGAEAGRAMLGWACAQHRFDRYRRRHDPLEGPRVLLTSQPGQRDAAVSEARATAMVRDLVNIPAEDMGPAALEAAAATSAERHGAVIRVTRGEALEDGFPLVHAVGRAAARRHAPRFVELEWGDPGHPRVAIVGKGVTFDSGGLDIKPSAGMRLMKKDMGGAAHALALAELVMAGGLPVRLHLLLPLAENAISSESFRPGDILEARDGTHVEIANTDAEGRLLLADALVRAGEERPDLLLDFATLTGAARVALGPDLPALFANDDDLAADLVEAGTVAGDPLWRLPLWPGYADMLSSDIADISNASEGGFAGAITAALFLARFVPEGTTWAHLDTFAWRPAARPGRPKGGRRARPSRDLRDAGQTLSRLNANDRPM